MAATVQAMKAGRVITSDHGVRYRIDGEIGSGGYGRVYRASRLAQNGEKSVKTVCVKVCTSADDWHGEAYFGRLLAGYVEVIEVFDSFAFGIGKRTAYALVMEYLAEGTIADRLDSDGWQGWSESKVRSEISRVLRVLKLMHAAGVTHRDIKPANVLLRDGHLVLGDFGISKQSLKPSRASIDAYTPAYAPADIDDYRHWGWWVDIYQVGLLACSLLTGEHWDTSRVSEISRIDAPDDLKCWIWHATAHKGLRYIDGADALDALKHLKDVDMRSTRGPRSLAGERVVITGKFDYGTQAQVSHRLHRAGAVVQSAVTDQTSILVRGRQVARTVGIGEGRKLFAVRERKRRGQPISIIDETRLLGLVR